MSGSKQVMAADVLVLGGGMSGLCAALSAAEHGARVLVLEKGSRFGGSMALSNGIGWWAGGAADSLERWRSRWLCGDFLRGPWWARCGTSVRRSLRVRVRSCSHLGAVRRMWWPRRRSRRRQVEQARLRPQLTLVNPRMTNRRSPSWSDLN
jgi:glycine/D-amino acid oxidase-like deaminating enzyme